MKIWKGNIIKLKVKGQSHSKSISMSVLNFPKMKIDFENLNRFLSRRRATTQIWSTNRIENDSPIFNNINDGETNKDFSFSIKNNNVLSKDYDNLYGKPRPSHADICRYLKNGELSFIGGGDFSGRMTALYCVIGYLAKQYLKEHFNMDVVAYLSQVGKTKGKSYKEGKISLNEAIYDDFPALSNQGEMLEQIQLAKEKGDSIGAKIECIVFNSKAGIGGSMFDGLEGKISQLIYAIPAVKGVEFGLGFDFCEKTGSSSNDYPVFDNGSIDFISNNAGGIYGGISSGNDITLSVAIKPTPSIAREQDTIDLVNRKNCKIKIEGRHDVCIGVRAVPVVESMVALAILDSILGETDE